MINITAKSVVNGSVEEPGQCVHVCVNVLGKGVSDWAYQLNTDI